LYKKASRTKLNTKFWVVLRNDVLSWFESTTDPYFPKGNISLQYVSSCDPVDDNRFKLRTPERNYTFKADTADGRDEWVKSIQKVMFKTQHEGESVKLIIPLEAVLDVEKSPTLEFAETIEVRCVDSEDQMSVDSYFFASFHDGDKALKSIRQRLDARPSSDLPANDSAITLPTDGSAPQKQRTTQEGASHAASSGFKKLGSLLKPILHGSSSKHGDSHKDEVFERDEFSHDSQETLTPEVPVRDGYPPRQSGAAPAGMNEEKGWGGKLFKPVSKILGTSPTSSTHVRTSSSGRPGHPSEHRRASDHLADQLHIRQHLSRTGANGREQVTEVVEPTVNDGTTTDSEDEHETQESRVARMSFTSSGEQGYSMMEQTEEDDEEYAKTARKFRSVFSLSEKEELIDRKSPDTPATMLMIDFPGYLYRVLPVHGRFFVTPNYFCFRSSQLLYKTKVSPPPR
jgi:sterol 3beta-glucosyltransferase